MRRAGRYLWRIVYVVTILLLVSNRWGDRSLYPDRWNHPVEIYVVSHGYHSGLVIPREALFRLTERGNRGPKVDSLGKVAGRFAAYSWIEIGWGEARFYREVPTVGALTVRLALSALFRPGNESVLHVVGLTGTPREAFRDSDTRTARTLAGRVRKTRRAPPRELCQDRGQACRTNSARALRPSLFYRANGSFTSSTSATTGLPGSSPPPAFRPCRFSRRIPRA